MILTKRMKVYPQILRNVRVADKVGSQRKSKGKRGCGGSCQSAWHRRRILVRESGTEPVIRVMVEAATDEICTEYVNQVVNVMKEQGCVQE